MSYLCGLFYNVLFRSEIFLTFEATSGVPQGSHLGPLLFILSINDVSSVMRYSNLQIYADMKIVKKISSVTDAMLLHEDLDNFFKWCRSKNICLNINKCATISYTLRFIPI